MKTFIKLLRKEIKRIFKNHVVVAIFFGAPVLYGIMFGYVYQKAKLTDLPVIVVDYDESPSSDKLIDALNDNESIHVVKVLHDANGIKKMIIDHDYQAVITIPDNFEADILQRRYPSVTVDINTSNILTANFATKGIQAVLATINAGIEIETLKKQGLAPQYATERYESFKIQYNRWFNPGNSYLDFMWPGLIGAIMQQIFFMGLALSFARDFEDNYFAKLVRISNHSFYHILLKVIPYAFFGALMWGAVAVMYHYFNIPLAVESGSMLLLIVLFSLACIFTGILFSILIPNQLRATEFLMIIATPSFVLSGFTWPQVVMPDALKAIASSIPLTNFLAGFRKLAIYGGSADDVTNQVKGLLTHTLITLTASVLLLQIKINRQKRKHPALQKKQA